MPFSFKEKRRLLRHLSDPGNWENRFERPAALRLTRFFHVVSIDRSGWDIPQQTLFDAAKLAVARDFNIEPDLKFSNAPKSVMLRNLKNDINAEIELFGELLGPSWEELLALKAPLNDITDFNGQVDIPRQFLAEEHQDDLELCTDLERREQIWAQGHVLKTALANAAPPIKINADDVSDPTALLILLSRGTSIRDHRGTEWTYVALNTSGTRMAAEEMRKILRYKFHVAAQALAISFKDDRCLLAMNVAAMNEASVAHNRDARINKTVLKDVGPQALRPALS